MIYYVYNIHRFLAVAASFLRFCQNKKNSSPNLQNFEQQLKGVFAIFDVEHMLNGVISNFTP